MLNKVRQSFMQSALRSSAVNATAARSYHSDLGLDPNALSIVEGQGKQADTLNLWKAQVEHTKNALVLSSQDEIEKYVLSIVRDYFRTTKKASVTLDSAFTNHGLDSLDAIEFVIRIEDELGYMIDAENLEKFKKPRHFVNFIKQLEAYKTEFNRLPHQNNKYHFHFEEAFPGLPKLGH